jgi:hypothetical protein
MRYKRIETYRHTQNLLGTRKTYRAHAKLTQHTQGGIHLKVAYTPQSIKIVLSIVNPTCIKIVDQFSCSDKT